MNDPVKHSGEPDTICAVATPAGRGGLSVIRVSGPACPAIADKILGFPPTPRHAHYGPFHDADGQAIDTGISLYFPAPHSYTGEEVVEFQAHGGPVIVDLLLQEIVTSKLARLARPGEFTERAFLNNKIDLAQAEAVADLIDSSSAEAARCAARSLQGEFSKLIDQLIDSIIKLRTWVEASMDFPEEEIDFLASGQVEDKIRKILLSLDQILQQARQGAILKEGLTVVIAGDPNAGKSSLLNALAGQDRAIVTPLPGTTRDLVEDQIHIDGLPLNIIDTAGLRKSDDPVEQEGVKRAWGQILEADQILLVIDSASSTPVEKTEAWRRIKREMPNLTRLCLINNKIDLSRLKPEIGRHETLKTPAINLSAKYGTGIDLLRNYLKSAAGFNAGVEGTFIARRRHIDALQQAKECLRASLQQVASQKGGELAAEELRQAHIALEEITGKFTPDDLLGEIFSSFCIGK